MEPREEAGVERGCVVGAVRVPAENGEGSTKNQRLSSWSFRAPWAQLCGQRDGQVHRQDRCSDGHLTSGGAGRQKCRRQPGPGWQKGWGRPSLWKGMAGGRTTRGSRAAGRGPERKSGGQQLYSEERVPQLLLEELDGSSWCPGLPLTGSCPAWPAQ